MDTVSVHSFLDIPYIPSDPTSSQQFDLYLPVSLSSGTVHAKDIDNAPPLICFVHGGAWRSEDKADHAELGRNIATYTGFPLAIPNYRLSPREPTKDNYLHHPQHAQDILRFLEFIVQEWKGPRPDGLLPYDPKRIYLIGHSCSAHMLSSILLDSQFEDLTPSAGLFNAVQAVIFSEGIYDIDLLLSSFPNYRNWFIEAAFGQEPSYPDVSALTMNLRPAEVFIRWFVIHSKGDTLVDVRQSAGMYEHICKQYESRGLRSSAYVTKDFDQLKKGHNEILKGQDYVKIAGAFIAGDASRSI